MHTTDSVIKKTILTLCDPNLLTNATRRNKNGNTHPEGDDCIRIHNPVHNAVKNIRNCTNLLVDTNGSPITD